MRASEMKFPAFEPIDLKNNVDSVSVEELLLSQVYPNPDQPRKHFQEFVLKELADSIKQYGVIQPIIVSKVDSNHYQIIAGERRWRASNLAGLTVIPAIIQTNNTEKNVAISLIENIQREELNPIELAQAFEKLSHEHGLSHEAIASMLGKSRTTVTNLLRLLNLTVEVRDLLVVGKLDMGHARALLMLPSDQQIILARKIIEDNLTVRSAEKLVQLKKNPKKQKTSRYDDQVQDWVADLSKALSANVEININSRGEGRVVIHFQSPGEVDTLVDNLSRAIEV